MKYNYFPRSFYKRLKLVLSVFAILLLSAATAVAQKKISGTVADVNKEPLIGVTVHIKGSMKASVSNSDGAFSIEAKTSDTLVFTYIGFMAKEVAVGNNTRLSVIMETNSSKLNEVVVVGYGTQRKSDLTGAVASLNTKVLEERPTTNIVSALQGSVPGLNIAITGSGADGSNSVTRIRGTKSITADARPLIILDGIPFDGAFAEINPNDIQSLEVLKDASSAAIYGARGANGVILITTKKGTEGKLTVAYDGFVSFDKAINIPKMMDGETFWNTKVEALKAANTITPTPDNPEPWLGAITPTEQRMHDEGLSTDWVKVATQNGLKQQHNFSFSGGNKTTKYFVSINHADIKGVALNDKFGRDNLRFNFAQELTSWMKFSTNTQVGRYARDGWPPDFGRAFRMVPLAEPYDENGNIRLSAWEDASVAFAKNPLSAINEKNSDKTTKLISNNALDITFPFVPGLSYKLNTGYTFQANNYKNYQGRDTYEGSQANGVLNTSNTETNDWIIENILSYNREFGKHRLFLTGLYSAQSRVVENNSITGRDFPNDVMYYYQASKAGTLSSTASYTKVNHESQMFRANYSFDGRYLLTATARRDGYSAFGDNTKYGVFPSLAAGWNISNEAFYRQSGLANILTNFKYRVSWGKNGNEAVNAYVTLPNLSTFNYLSDDHKAMYGFYPSRLASPNLGWETTASVNTGFDFELWQGRVSGTFDAFWANTTDLLLSRTIPSINGTNSVTENIGKTYNSGYEFQINVNAIRSKDFSWTATLNYSHYNTKIKDVGLYDENGKPVDDVGSRWFIGQPIDVNYDYVFDGIWQIIDKDNPTGQQDPNYRYSIPGNVKYKDVDGKDDITTADRQVIGRTIPDFTASIINTFSYKDFTLSFFLNGMKGVTARNVLLEENDMSYRQNVLDKVFWTPGNPINTYPKNDLNGSVNPLKSGYYRKTDFIRLQDITLSYKLPAKLTSQLHLQRLNVYANVKNLATWTSWTGLDPEFIGNQLAAPQTRSFIIGLRIGL
ncbi:SusC/RagA family TonB-linked outer membrane protein [Chitinophaga caeni]|uniref:SusC/RagA family TonB-linked outer membrane protein n=1 Tax=Chitinophaga caeni TaxID=2029983 RepID=A0A291QZ62_9BACT|nr:TonB-dependent receptor [Chitinophaga caeni]ATL49250.1 SusC/RagA family TonB-linked outer membrane protein [Chitinophaga caeni]